MKVRIPSLILGAGLCAMMLGMSSHARAGEARAWLDTAVSGPPTHWDTMDATHAQSSYRSFAGSESARSAFPSRICLMSLSGELFAVDLRHVREVFELESVTPVPGNAGVTDRRGQPARHGRAPRTCGLFWDCPPPSPSNMSSSSGRARNKSASSSTMCPRSGRFTKTMY